MKKKQFYLILNKKNKYTYGAFPRTKDGKEEAVAYKEKLKKKHKAMNFIIK
jgi:hypothetical protein